MPQNVPAGFWCAGMQHYILGFCMVFVVGEGLLCML